MIGDYEPYMRQRREADRTDATQLWREIRDLGYPGGYSRVRDYLASFRATAAIPAPASQPPKARKWPAGS
jgi:hypothetical protein